MGITFRHDASAVGSVPSGGGGSRRKYGYDLVSQQMQQKYDSYQRGMDRWYDAAQNRANNNFQLFRDNQQNNARMAQMEQDFRLGEQQRQNTFDRDQQAAAAARQQAMLDSAREQTSSFIMGAIENGEFDPVTARELQQNLISESEILGNPNLDATQRAEALGKLRARREVLLSTRKPQATPTDRANKNLRYYDEDQRRYVSPDEIRPGSRVSVIDMETGMERPYVDPSQNQQSANQFASDPKVRKQYIDEAINILTEGGAKTLTLEMRKKAAALAEELYYSDNPQPAPPEPTLAPTLPGTEKSLEPIPQGISLEQVERLEKGNIGGSILENPQPDPGSQPSQNSDPGDTNDPALVPPSNPWSDAVSPEEDIARPGGNAADTAKPEGAPTPAPKQERKERDMEAIKLSGLPEAKRPNFNRLEKEIGDEEDKALIRQVRVLANQGYPPDVTNALYLILDPNASPDEAYQANAYLLSKGIDINQIASPPAEKPFHSNKNRDWQSGRGL